MSEKLEELISLLYQDRLTQYGKRLLIENIEKLQKENEVLKNQEATQKKINELLVQRYSNSISVQKVKDRIEKYKELSDKFYVKFLESDRYNTDIREKGIKCDAIILALEELIEEREEE